MTRRWVGALVRWVATVMMTAGVAIYTIGLLGGILILMEGVTGLVGEGERLRPESPEQIRERLAIVGGLVGVVAIGWALARLGNVYQQPQRLRPRVSRLVAELMLLLGGVGLAAGVLVWCSPRSAGYEVPEAYRRVGIVAVVGGLVCLGLGWVLIRRSARHSYPGAAVDRGHIVSFHEFKRQ